MPNVFLFLWPGSYQYPPFFAGGLYRKVLHRGENVVVFPYGATGPSMMWQAQTAMYFSMSGGYTGPTPAEFRRWPIVNSALAGLRLADAGRQLRSFLAAHRVDTVIAADGAGALPAALGIKPIELGGVSIYQLPPNSPAAVPNQSVDQLQMAAGLQWIGEMLEAARRFLAAGQTLASLNPAKLNEVGLLPDSRWGATLELVLAGASHAAITSLWIGPGPNQTVEVGLFVSPAAAAALASRYASQATSILYPYPLRYTRVASRDQGTEFLLLRLRLACVSGHPVPTVHGPALKVVERDNKEKLINR